MLRKVWIGLAGLTLLAAPALADTPPRMMPLERQLSAIAAANPGNIGIAALDLKSGEMVSIHGDTPFPMASVVKVAIAANYLAQVENGRRSLDDKIGGQSARSLLHHDDLPRFTKLHPGRVVQRQALALHRPFSEVRGARGGERPRCVAGGDCWLGLG